MPLTPKQVDQSVSAWFLGPRAENYATAKELFTHVLNDQERYRRDYHDLHNSKLDLIDQNLKEQKHYTDNIESLKNKVKQFSRMMIERSIPFFSPRYIGHMCMEMSLPAIMGWITALMFNPNNVAFEASPITTWMELQVGRNLCEMLGYQYAPGERGSPDDPWGHITCDGTVANAESMWAARNLKYYPLAVYLSVVEGDLMFIREKFTVTPAGRKGSVQPKLLKDLNNWELLNLPTKEILSINSRLHSDHGISSKFLEDALSPYLVQTIGKEKLFERLGIDPYKPPQYLISSTRHYSWPKSAALLGIGSENCCSVPVDNLARIDTVKLRAILDEKLAKKEAVYAVVGIVGSTEEGVVDSIDRIVAMREEYAEKGLTFIVHADAAWGGYFASMTRAAPLKPEETTGAPSEKEKTVPIIMRESIVCQFKALADVDSITVDPHKAGYIPYPAGALCYRDSRMRFLLTWKAPYLHDDTTGESIGIYGIEGSKPGAAAVACLLHHQVVGLHEDGHGALLKQVTYTCRLFAAHWATMSTDISKYIVVPFNPLESEGNVDEERDQKQRIRDTILDKENLQLVEDEDAMNELSKLGSDLNINAFACNFRINGKPNEDIEDANYLNNRIFARFSVTSPNQNVMEIQLFLSSTIFGEKDYGNCLRNFQRRLGLVPDINSPQDLFVLRNVVMSPFQCKDGYPKKIAADFLKVLEEETDNAIERATVSPQKHSFTVQGRDQIYLVYHPHFHRANGRSQLILSAEIKDEDAKDAYKQAYNDNNSGAFTCMTEKETTLDEIIEAKKFSASLSLSNTNSEIPRTVHFENIQVIKRRSLESRWRDKDYPKSTMPFYLYGTRDEKHIEHMLLRAPNVQVTASDVALLELKPNLSDQQLKKGVILHIEKPERALQPPTEDNKPENMFKPESETVFDFFISEDVHPVQSHGPGLAEGGQELAKGKLKLGKFVYIDWRGESHLNRQDFVKDAKPIVPFASGYASTELRREWKEVVAEAMNF